MHLRPRLVAAFLAAGVLAAIAPADPALVLVGASVLVALLVVVDVALAPRASALQPRRTVAAVLRMGRPADLLVELHNPTGRTLAVDIHDATPPSMDRDPRRHHVSIEPMGWSQLSASVRPRRRGRASIGPLTIRTAGPLGLAGRQSTVPMIDEVKVYPALRGRAEVELRSRRAQLLQSGLRSTAYRGGSDEFDSLREYRSDDEFRRINWKATARSPRPIANDYREEHNQQVVMLLDASRATAGQVAGVSRLEHSLDAAIAVADLAARVGDHVGALAFGRDVRAFVAPRGGPSQPPRILQLLFDLEAGLYAPNYPLAFATLLARHRRRSWLVMFTDLSEESVLEPLLRAIPVLLSRHLLVVASVRDPEIETLATSIPWTSDAAYERASAAGFVTWRDRAAARIRGLGATVIDAQPGALAASVADEYLQIKSRGRL
ncbi:MAG: hypothetical protein K0R20_73 [Actinomycetia bacterium]|jgi:uncharacterized protein (DUF58 family)|nr:hypothetical protein [Actinomycetes bacterium]